MQMRSIVSGMSAAVDHSSKKLVQLAVVEMDGAWRIYLNGRKIGRFAAHGDALTCALDVARETRADGLPVEVLAQGRFGELTTIADRGRAC